MADAWGNKNGLTPEQQVVRAFMLAGGRHTEAEVDRVISADPASAQWVGERLRPVVENMARDVAAWLEDNRELIKRVLDTYLCEDTG